ncbi:MAG: hypothetical protein IJM42_06850 [Synergistes sp.]|nr:hypothetical protein [Synergistes sp.]MCR5335524.1 hypothetical protein [Synergistes sp.]
MSGYDAAETITDREFFKTGKISRKTVFSLQSSVCSADLPFISFGIAVIIFTGKP